MPQRISFFQNVSIELFWIFSKKSVFETRNANSTDEISLVIEDSNFTKVSSTKLTAAQASLKKNEIYVFKNLFDKKEELNPRLD